MNSCKLINQTKVTWCSLGAVFFSNLTVLFTNSSRILKAATEGQPLQRFWTLWIINRSAEKPQSFPRAGATTTLPPLVLDRDALKPNTNTVFTDQI